MSFSAIAGVLLKLPRLFSRKCRWVLVRMAVNCRVSGFQNKLLFQTKPKKGLSEESSQCRWKLKRKLVFCVVLVVLTLSVFSVFTGVTENGRDHKRVDEISDFWVKNARLLQGRFNLNNTSHQETINCITRTELHVSTSRAVGYCQEAMDLDGVELEKKHGWLMESLETEDQCLVQDDQSLEKFEIPSLPDVQTSGTDMFHTWLPQDSKLGSCEGLLTIFMKGCWYAVVGLTVCWKIFNFKEKVGINLKWKQDQEQPQSLLQKQQLQPQGSRSGKWRKKLLILFLVMGVAGSFWLFWFMNKNIVLWRKETLANMCDERARMLQDQFNVSMNHVHALAILVSTFHHGKNPSAIDQKTFAEYTERTAFERPLTSGVAYALKVLHSEREQFEKEHGWVIKKMGTEDQSMVRDYTPEELDPSPVEEEYAPVIFCQETVSHIVSIDMMSGKEDGENILRARATGKGVLTSPFKLLKSNHLGVVLTYAIYNTELPKDATPQQRIEATEGYLGASYDFPLLVEKLLHQLASKQTIVVNVFDTTNQSAPISMYGPIVTNTNPLHISNLDFGDPLRKHEMHCRFKQKSPPPWTAIMASIGVLVITLLLAHIFHAAINRIAKVEDDFRDMMELKVRAEAADVAKSQFLATVSHEIRTPMNGVLGMLQMLMDTELDANQLDYAETAHASGNDLISLINQVLDQAKIESGRLELEAVQFDLRAVLDNVLSLFSGKSHDKGIELAVYISDRVPQMVIGDPVRFRQIITNLVGNSVKFTEQGHIFVSVHIADEVMNTQGTGDDNLKQQSGLVKNGLGPPYNTLSGFPVVDRLKSWEKFKLASSGSSVYDHEPIRLLITVEDTGVGIPRDAQSRIFMPFMQADSSTSRTYGGTGIGLSISKCLVGMMDGEIGFVSEPGIGTTFSFTVAFTKGQTSSFDTKRYQIESAISEFQGLRGLVVDAKSVRAEVARYHLCRLGISVDTANNLKSAWSCIRNCCATSATTRLDMVLIDHDGWDGETTLALPQLLKELRQSEKDIVFKKWPKIFLLATSRSNGLDKFKSAGLVDDVIMKPLRLSMLVTCFQQALTGGTKKQQDRRKPSFLQNLLKGRHILVVDDNVVNRRVAAGALKKYGAKVTCVESGKDALSMLRPPHDFDACFMDLQMPEMDGFEATRQIRFMENELNKQIEVGEVSDTLSSNAKHWHVPILAMTADVVQARHEKCIQCGMDGYVSKPFEEDQLYKAVMQFFESDRQI
ncbi:hypothetical protein Syun_009612 [Stephania yunnanensis]|uniref:histidine kinase n=1 Tax=Stephania yunnanensis TaxID=152371 RepID=A0AAP0KEU5_9MAGN